MALIALPFILVLPSRQGAGGGGEKEDGWERVKPEGGRQGTAWPWVFSTTSKKAAHPPASGDY